MAVNLQRRALLGLGLLWVSGVPAFAGVDVAGVWSTIERRGSDGTSGDQMVFAGRHAIYLIDAGILDATYAVDGNTLALTPLDERHGPTHRYEFKIEGNKLTVLEEGAKPRVMTRVTKKRHPNADPIVGKWTWPILGVGEWRAVQRFARSGDTQIVVPPIDIDSGSYHVTGDTLELELPRQGTLTFTVRREGNLLITRNANGVETKFAKFVY